MFKTKIIGLTGQTGAGKTTVAELFAGRGIHVIDCDKVSRDVANEDKQCLADLALAFTIDILNSDGTLNRQRLADHAFADKASTKKLNTIILPYIIKSILEITDGLKKQGVPYVMWDAPTLFESKLNKHCDAIISVIAPVEERLNRILVRDHLTNEEAQQRINAQHDEDFYKLQSDFVIENNGTIADLKLGALDVLDKIKAL